MGVRIIVIMMSTSAIIVFMVVGLCMLGVRDGVTRGPVGARTEPKPLAWIEKILLRRRRRRMRLLLLLLLRGLLLLRIVVMGRLGVVLLLLLLMMMMMMMSLIMLCAVLMMVVVPSVPFIALTPTLALTLAVNVMTVGISGR